MGHHSQSIQPKDLPSGSYGIDQKTLEAYQYNYYKTLHLLAADNAGLTEAELVEQALLRKEYIADWRAGVESQLENTYIVDAQGNKRKLEKKK